MFLEADKLEKMILSIPFPAGVKLRISVTGLAFAELGRAQSKINFLRHIRSHELRMSVIKRDTITSVNTLLGTFILDESPVSITTNPVNATPARIKDPDTTLPELEKIINLLALHGGHPIERRTPPPDHLPSMLTLNNCSFYTMNYFRRDCFELIDLGPSGNRIRNELGFILGGSIRATAETETTITFSPGMGGLSQPLPGRDAATNHELVYDIIFNNNCNDIAICSSDVVHTGGTDFAFYYQALQEQNAAARTFILMKLMSMSCGGVLGTVDVDEEEKIENKGRDMTSDIAACNPVIISPDPGGY